MSTPSDSPTADENTDLGFADLGLDDRVLQALTDVGYESPSPIQAATIPALLDGRHVVGLAQTGTGKTAAFALPILSRIDVSARRPQALVITPTRELALQVSEAITRYAHHIPGLHVLPVYGGTQYGGQLAALKRGAQVIVGTPGRIIDHLEKKTLDLRELKFLVLDEADEMLQMGFQDDVETILAETPDDKQVALFSATMPPAIRRIAQRYLRDAAEITVRNDTVTAANTRQRYIVVPHNQKLDALTRVLEVEPFEAMIVFVRTKQATEELAERLRARGLSAAAINGDLVQAQRERTINQLRTGDLDILVATDVAARGLDVERISHVVNYDIPHDTEAYIHRIGRTGRAGRDGDALLFVTPRERHLLKAIEKATRQPIEVMPIPTVEDVNQQRVTRFDDAIVAKLDAPDLDTFRGLVNHFVRTRDVPAEEVAAALAALWQDDQSFLLPPDPPPSALPETTRSAPRGSSDRVAGHRKRPPGAEALATYRIRVGRRHKVQPGQIVGAIANEGGLSRSDFGHIQINGDHTLVELPAQLPPRTLDALRRTRISGQLIELTREHDRPKRVNSSANPNKPAKKPYRKRT